MITFNVTYTTSYAVALPETIAIPSKMLDGTILFSWHELNEELSKYFGEHMYHLQWEHGDNIVQVTDVRGRVIAELEMIE